MPQRNSYEPIPSDEDDDEEVSTGKCSSIRVYSLIAVVVVTLVAIGCIALVITHFANQTDKSWLNSYSSEMYAQMDLTVDPCQDFYQFVCGKHHLVNTTLQYFPSKNFDDLNDFVTGSTRLALAKSSQEPSSSSSTSKAAKYIIDLYQECVNLNSRDQLGATQPAGSLLKQVLGNGSLFEEGSFDDQLPNVQEWMDYYVEAWLFEMPSTIRFNIVNSSPIQISFTYRYSDAEQMREAVSRYLHVKNQTQLDEAIVEVVNIKALEPITGIKINGEQTLSENIADNVGVKQAYRSFEAQLSTCADCGASIDGQFSAEQLFFIAYGQAYCGNHRNSSKLHWITQIDSHSPFKFRVNIPLANLDKFAHAFNCPVGSDMNPEQKCLFW